MAPKVGGSNPLVCTISLFIRFETEHGPAQGSLAAGDMIFCIGYAAAGLSEAVETQSFTIKFRTTGRKTVTGAAIPVVCKPISNGAHRLSLTFSDGFSDLTTRNG